MFDINKTIELIKGGLFEPRATWQSYLAENRGWQDTAVLLTLPLIIVSSVLAALLSLLFRGHGTLGPGMGFGSWLISLIMAVISIAAVAFIFSYLAGVFKGRHDFNKGLAALSLAAVPGYVGGIVAAVPFIGWLVALALFVTTLVFLYQIIPSYFKVPQDKRVLHYIVSLVVSFVVMLILGAVLGFGGMMPMHRNVSMTEQPPAQVGMFEDIERYAQFMEAAERDRFAPPEEGVITESQMEEYMDVMRKTSEIRNEQIAKMERLKEEYEDKEPTAADLGKIAGGIGSVLGAFNAEMEVVMTGKGNWKEHQWVKEQLRIARIQRDISEAVKHNYAMYQAHQVELDRLSATP